MIIGMRTIAVILIWLVGSSVALAACGGSTTPNSAPPQPSATAAASPTADLTPVPGGPAPAPTPPAGNGEFALPAPVCPGPAKEVLPPPVQVALPDGQSIVATPGSATLTTCTTGSASDTVGQDPAVGLTARAGDRLTVSVPPGWVILAYEGSDRPAVGEGANVTPEIVTTTGPSQVEMPIPARSGRSVVGVTLSIVSADGRVVGRIEALFQVEVD